MYLPILSPSPGDDVCGFVCIMSSLLRKQRVRAQVYHGDEDGVAHIMQRERKTRTGVYHRNKGTADSGTYYAAKSNYEAAISCVEFYGLSLSLSLSPSSLPPSLSLFYLHLPLSFALFLGVPLGAHPRLRSLAD